MKGISGQELTSLKMLIISQIKIARKSCCPNVGGLDSQQNVLSWINGCTLMSCVLKGFGKAHGQQAEDEARLGFCGLVHVVSAGLQPRGGGMTPVW